MSIDPLAPDYPHYSPYTFSGNRVLDAVELEGLEPKFLIDNGSYITGKLTKPVIALLNASFNFSTEGLQETIWVPSDQLAGVRPGSVKIEIYKRANKKMNGKLHAITLHKDVVYNTKRTVNFTDKKWLSQITHEASHRDEIHKSGGYIGWYSNYLNEARIKEYRKISTEKTAYRIEDDYFPVLMEWDGGIVLKTLANKDLSEEKKIEILKKTGWDFQANFLIPEEIKRLNKARDSLKGKGHGSSSIRTGIRKNIKVLERRQKFLTKALELFED